MSDVTELRMTEFVEMRVKLHEDANRTLVGVARSSANPFGPAARDSS